MKKIVKILPLLMIVTISSCKRIINVEQFIDQSKDNNEEGKDAEKKQMEIRFSCGENGITTYLDQGWIILEESTEEKICTWKSFPANEVCDMEKDKGCKITMPDKIGEEKIYLLEK
tara:strand:+ start:78 stop:425 length:348 start_codon:yes stop_codon:yes gene_type:complete